MLELLFIPFAIVFIAVQLSNGRFLRVGFAALILLALATGLMALRMDRYYGRTYISLVIGELAKMAPPEQRERLIAASDEFKTEFKKERASSVAASARLWNAIKQVNYDTSREGEQAGAGGSAARSELESEGGDKPQPESEGGSR